MAGSVAVRTNARGGDAGGSDAAREAPSGQAGQLAPRPRALGKHILLDLTVPDTALLNSEAMLKVQRERGARGPAGGCTVAEGSGR